jgi:hypothetical protein
MSHQVKAYTVNRADLVAYDEKTSSDVIKRQVLKDEKVFRINADERGRPLLRTQDNLIFYAYPEDLVPAGTVQFDATDKILGGTRMCFEVVKESPNNIIRMKPDNPHRPAIENYHNELLKRGFKYDEFWSKYDFEIKDGNFKYYVVSSQVLDAQNKGHAFTEKDGVCITSGVYRSSPCKESHKEHLRRNSKLTPDIQAAKSLEYIDAKIKELEQGTFKVKNNELSI